MNSRNLFKYPVLSSCWKLLCKFDTAYHRIRSHLFLWPRKLHHHGQHIEKAGIEGVEPPHTESKSVALPLRYMPVKKYPRTGSNRRQSPCKGATLPLSYLGVKLCFVMCFLRWDSNPQTPTLRQQDFHLTGILNRGIPIPPLEHNLKAGAVGFNPTAPIKPYINPLPSIYTKMV